ncbi:SCO family protein [Leptospira bouyouniensis]|uniref:SCO family protein n=1 Tax=Leptospira bouyouniensis TaxID=2484911 RepID=A0ABY2LBU2_9LEPT|nr:SCO family protein [Leptospira bouyouniensis]TGK52941.1 SCO family protein [Leptospira bouyouniensis]
MDRSCLKKVTFVFLILFNLIQYGCQSKADINREVWNQLGFVKPNGESLDPKFWSEKKSVLYFGFSHCPDMCPLALTNFGRASLILGEKGKEFQFVFITLDPERDSPSTLEKYVQNFPSKNLTALSPNVESLEALTKMFGIVKEKVGDGNSYRIDHSNFIYVLDEKLNTIKTFPGGVSANALATELRKLSVP